MNAEACTYFALFFDCPPDALNTTGAKRERYAVQAISAGEGKLCRLLSLCETLARFNLRWHHLGLTCEDAYIGVITAELVQRWRDAITRVFPNAPLLYTLELGVNGALHAHILADVNAGLLHLKRGGEVVQTDLTLEQIADYDGKAHFAWTQENLAIYWRSKQLGRLPRLTGSMNLTSVKRWQREGLNTHLSASVLTFPNSPKTAGKQDTVEVSNSPDNALERGTQQESTSADTTGGGVRAGAIFSAVNLESQKCAESKNLEEKNAESAKT